MTNMNCILDVHIENLEKERIPMKKDMNNLQKKVNELTLGLSNITKQLKEKDVQLGQNEDKLKSQKIQLKKSAGLIRKLKRDIHNLACIDDNQVLRRQLEYLSRNHVNTD